jgi:hypothetical protein
MLMDAAAAHLRCHPNVRLEKIRGTHRQKLDLRPYDGKVGMLNIYASDFN